MTLKTPGSYIPAQGCEIKSIWTKQGKKSRSKYNRPDLGKWSDSDHSLNRALRKKKMM